jgi:hypothetical protein
MVRTASATTGRARLLAIVIVMAAVTISLTLHHGVMANSPAEHDHSIAHLLQPAGEPVCLVNCHDRSHSMPVCCGMGLCQSGLPVGPQPVHAPPSLGSTDFYYCALSPRHSSSRIDRPPKNPVRDAV